MAQSLKERILDMYKLSDCPVILTDNDYNFYNTNEGAASYFDKKIIDEIIVTAKRTVGENLNGSFILDDSRRFFVNTFVEGEESIKVISLDYSNKNPEVKALFRSSVYEINYRRGMFNLIENLNSMQTNKNRELVEKAEKELYSLCSLMQLMLDRHKCETGLRSYFESNYSLVDVLDSVLNQTNMVMKVLGMNIEYDFTDFPKLIVNNDKDGFALSVIKLLRGLCPFATDKTVKVSIKMDGEIATVSFLVKSQEITKWLEKSVEVDNFMSVIKRPKELQDAFFITDALNEFKYDGISSQYFEDGEYTTVALRLNYDKMESQSLNAAPLMYLGDPYSLLTIFFTPLEN